MADPIDFRALAAPFPPEELEWRVGNKSKDQTKATLLVYLTSRAVQQRLDDVVGPAGWRDSYTPVLEGAKTIGYLCTLELEVAPGVWVGKTDVSDVSDVEPLKGGVSGALKRAAVKWGIGRYLYDLGSKYQPIREGYGPDNAVYCPLADKKPGHILPPALPAWALPATTKAESAPAPTPKPAPRPAPAPKPEPPALVGWSADQWAKALEQADAQVTVEEVVWHAQTQSKARKHPKDLPAERQAAAFAYYTSPVGYGAVRKAVDQARTVHRNAFFGHWSQIRPIPRKADGASPELIESLQTESDEARRLVMRAWYGVDSLKLTPLAELDGKHGISWLRDLTHDEFGAAVDLALETAGERGAA